MNPMKFYRVWFSGFWTALLCVVSIPGATQEVQPGWAFNNVFIADNHEYFDTYPQPQTIFGIRTTGYGTLEWDSTGQIGLGAQYFHEFGSGFNGELLQPMIFFEWQTGPIEWRGGSMPRKSTREYPRALIRDSIKYFRPYVQGLTARWQSDWGQQLFWIDWTSRQTQTRREIFVFGLAGKFNHRNWLLDYEALMHHRAGPGQPLPNDALRDNGGARIMLGKKFDDALILDSMEIKSGLLTSFDRMRNVYDWRIQEGWISELSGYYRNFGTHHTIYYGDGHDLRWGDPFYRGQYYSRHEFFYQYQKGPVSARFTWSFHRAGQDFHNEQTLFITIDLAGHNN